MGFAPAAKAEVTVRAKHIESCARDFCVLGRVSMVASSFSDWNGDGRSSGDYAERELAIRAESVSNSATSVLS